MKWLSLPKPRLHWRPLRHFPGCPCCPDVGWVCFGETYIYIADSRLSSAHELPLLTFREATVTMPLCARCQTINFRPPPLRLDAEPRVANSGTSRNSIPTTKLVESNETPKLIYVLHETQQSFLDSLAQGCRFCLLVSSQLVRPAAGSAGTQGDYAKRLRTARTTNRLGRRDTGIAEVYSGRSGAGEPSAILGAVTRPRDHEAGEDFMVLRRSWFSTPSQGPNDKQKYKEPDMAKSMAEFVSTSDVHVWSRIGSACLRVIDALPCKSFT